MTRGSSNVHDFLWLSSISGRVLHHFFFIIRLSLRRDVQADNRWSHEPLCAHTLPRIQRSHEPLGAHALLPRIRRRILLASPKAFDAWAIYERSVS
ncbi:hypothetical protein NDU88_009247 [Pleurodeles waltl]|uniref:Uncharacterized protein n=1 Tax=Pleurodeles waltl TaxID=8319 RepID=A0AAV7S0G7_PLEWA|nr:hypothetical protein NDU88_009247 [Pleurodeles waltl]